MSGTCPIQKRTFGDHILGYDKFFLIFKAKMNNSVGDTLFTEPRESILILAGDVLRTRML